MIRWPNHGERADRCFEEHAANGRRGVADLSFGRRQSTGNRGVFSEFDGKAVDGQKAKSACFEEYFKECLENWPGFKDCGSRKGYPSVQICQ